MSSYHDSHPISNRRIRGVLICGSSADLCRLELKTGYFPEDSEYLKSEITGWEEAKRRLISEETIQEEVDRILVLVL